MLASVVLSTYNRAEALLGRHTLHGPPEVSTTIAWPSTDLMPPSEALLANRARAH